jgi:hypothetical protein
MAEGVNEPDRVVRATDDRAARALPSAVAPRRGSRASTESASPHSHKFRTVTAVLAGVAVVAIVIAVVLVASDSKGGTGPQWSAWQPQDGGNQGAREIADHLAPFYRLSGTDQLDVVTVINLGNPNTVGTNAATGSSTSNGLQVAVRPNANASGISLLSGKTIAYNLCGVGGSNCSIGGTPSADRLLLLRREALELALYTFKYIGGTENVVAVLPPGHTTVTSQLTSKPPSQAPVKSTAQPLDTAVLFVREELAPWLRQPLLQTLTQYPPIVAQLPLWHNTQEASLVDQITARGLFSEKLETAQDGTQLLVLDPQPPQ